jgi:hypothetical protein
MTEKRNRARDRGKLILMKKRDSLIMRGIYKRNRSD